MPSVPDLVIQVYDNVGPLPSPALVAQVYENVGTGLPPEELAGELVYPPPCHIPHKNWASAQEAENYFHIERWSYVMHSEKFPVQLRLHLPYKNWADEQEATNYFVMERWALDTQLHGYIYPLHFPFKRWADDWMEEDNYRYLENWALSFTGYPGKESVGVPPIYPNLYMQVYENVT